MAWIDEDGDGFHDETGESRTEYNRRAGTEADEAEERDDYYMGRDGAPDGGWYEEGPTVDEYHAGAERRESARRDSRDGGDYAGEDPTRMTDRELGIGSSNGFDEGSEGTLVWGDLSGANQRMANYRRERERAERAAAIEQTEAFLPSADDLWVQYEEEGEVEGPGESALGQATADEGSISAQRDALSELQAIYEGEGLTSADRARQQLLREQTGMATRAQREADQAMLAQRGMGSSGQSVAALLGGQQSGAQALSQADAQIQIDAQRRALQAMQAAGGLAGDIRGQSFDEDSTRRSARDDYAMATWNARRDRERFNTEMRNKTRESRAGSRQQAFQNRTGMLDRRINYSPNSRDPSEVAGESNERSAGLIQGFLDSF